MMYRLRIKKLQDSIRKENLDGYIIYKREELSHSHDVRYLCGFTGDTGLLIVLASKAYLIVDSRFHTQAHRQAKGVKVIAAKSGPLEETKNVKELQGSNIRLGFETNALTYNLVDSFRENLPKALIIPTSGVVNSLSIIKDKNEQGLIAKAIEISETALERVFGFMKTGIREFEVAAELEYQMKMLGAEKPAFDTIVASGYRSALPHGVASEKKIAKGDFVTFDFGAWYKGYVADITRTVVMGKATVRQKKIYNTVLRANQAAIRKVKSGVSGFDVDKAARSVIKRAGYSKYFGHGTGHGIGIYVHVGPNAGPRSKDILKRGMVVTIEPGIYIPKWGGVRIEDDVLVTNTGSRVLTSAPKKLLEL
jgi:Xaa-Pro aminopeptidase